MATTLYLIEPHEHGNGGWHGSSVLAEVAPELDCEFSTQTIFLV